MSGSMTKSTWNQPSRCEVLTSHYNRLFDKRPCMFLKLLPFKIIILLLVNLDNNFEIKLVYNFFHVHVCRLNAALTSKELSNSYVSRTQMYESPLMVHLATPFVSYYLFSNFFFRVKHFEIIDEIQVMHETHFQIHGLKIKFWRSLPSKPIARVTAQWKVATSDLFGMTLLHVGGALFRNSMVKQLCSQLYIRLCVFG